MTPLLLTVAEVARELRMSVCNARRLITSRRLASVKIGGKRGKTLVRRQDLEAAVLRARVAAVGESSHDCI